MLFYLNLNLDPLYAYALFIMPPMQLWLRMKVVSTGHRKMM